MSNKMRLHKKVSKDRYKESNITYNKGLYIQQNLNGSLVISDDKGNKEIYYGYSLNDAIKKFKKDRKR